MQTTKTKTRYFELFENTMTVVVASLMAMSVIGSLHAF